MQNKQNRLPEANAGIGEYIGQEAGQKQARTQNQQSYVTIEISQYRDNLLYPVPVSVENRFVKHIADGSSDAQLRQIEKAKQVLHRTRQPDKVRPQFLKKYLPGEKGDEKGDKVKNTLTRAFRWLLWRQDSDIVKHYL